MRVLVLVLFIFIGMALSWLLFGVAAAVILLCQRKLRDRVLQLHRLAVEQSVREYAARAGRCGRPRQSEQAIQAWERTRRQRIFPLTLFAVQLTFLGPVAFFRLQDLRRSRNEIRFE